MADEDWLKAYEKGQKENKKLERMSGERLSSTPIGNIIDEIFLLFALAAFSLCENHSSADITDQTLTQANQSGDYFQNFENSQKIEEITYDYIFSPT